MPGFPIPVWQKSILRYYLFQGMRYVWLERRQAFCRVRYSPIPAFLPPSGSCWILLDPGIPSSLRTLLPPLPGEELLCLTSVGEQQLTLEFSTWSLELYSEELQD